MASTYRPPEGYLTMAQAQERLGVSKSTLQKLVRNGRLAVQSDQRNGRVRLVRAGDIARLTEPTPESGGRRDLAAGVDETFARQVAAFIEEYRPALERLAQ